MSYRTYRGAYFWGLFGVFQFILLGNPVYAQLPNPILPLDRPPLPSPSPPSKPPPQNQIPDRPPPSTDQLDSIPGTIRVKQFEFVGNTAFSDRELATALQAFTDREITFAELLQVETIVTQKYTEAGFVNSGAVIPAGQTFSREAAIVQIQVIEGELETIRVTGTRRLNPDYVRSRIALATRPPLNRERLLEALQLLQLDPLIANISAELQTGSRPERSVLEVRVTEADPLSVEVFADNGRSPSVGSFRRGASLTHANLLGSGDRLQISYTNTDGSNAYDASYSLPINPRNGTLQVAVGITDTKVIEPPFDRIDITGNARIFELTYRQPLLQKPGQEIAVGVTASRLESETFIDGERFPLSPGSDDAGRTRVSVLRFFQEYVKRDRRQVFAARSQFSLGLDFLNATTNQDAPDSRFFSWRGQAQFARLLSADTLLLLRSDIQLAADELVPLEQLGLGGLNSVRGYRQDALLTDSGVFASAELRLPILRVPEVSGVLQIIPFLDFGVGWNQSNTSPKPDSDVLLGAGLGLLWQMSDRFSARLDYGIPLIRVDDSDRTWQENGLYFRLNYFPF